MTDVLTVSQLGSALASRWRTVLAMTLAFGAVGLTVGLLTPQEYTSKAVLFVIAGPADQDGVYQAAQFAEKRAATYPALISSPEVLEPTRAALDLTMSQSRLRQIVTASNPTDSPLVEVTATAPQAGQAREIADRAADELATFAIAVERRGSRVSTVSIQKVVPAPEPLSPSSPSPVLLAALGMLVGAALGVVTALLLRTWRGAARRRDPGLDTALDEAAVAPAVEDDAGSVEESAVAPSTEGTVGGPRHTPGPLERIAAALPSRMSLPAQRPEDAGGEDDEAAPTPREDDEDAAVAAASAPSDADPAGEDRDSDADEVEPAASRADDEQEDEDDGTERPVPRQARTKKLTVVGGAQTAHRPVPRRRGPRGARRPVTTTGRPFAFEGEDEGDLASDAREADLS